MAFWFKGNQVSFLEDDVRSKLAGSVFFREYRSKSELLAKLFSVSNVLPLDTSVRIEKIYRMTRGYEPSKPRPGSVLDSVTLTLKSHGAWYDPKTGKAKPPRWIKS